MIVMIPGAVEKTVCFIRRVPVGLDMECKECGTNVEREAHDNGICFDCYCQMDLRSYEEHQKKNYTLNSEEE